MYNRQQHMFVASNSPKFMKSLNYEEEVEHASNLDAFHNESVFNLFPKIPVGLDAERVHGFSEQNGQFEYIANPDFQKSLILKYKLPIFDDGTVRNISIESTLNAPKIVDYQPFFKKLINTYSSVGIVGVCKQLTSDDFLIKNRQNIPKVVQHLANSLVSFVDFINAPINPFLAKNKKNFLSIAEIKGSSWNETLIKVFKWHPTHDKYAIVFTNDAVQIYSHSQVPVTLKHQKQVEVTCLAWKPFYPSVLAVGCANTIIIWDTEIIPASIKPASSCSFTLSKIYHNDIIDLQWYPKSDYLLSLATKDNQIIIWDVTLKKCIPIKRIGNFGFSFARFSFNGLRLFTADLSTKFRIWNPSDYSFEEWSSLESRCKNACWSPNGKIVLYSCHNSALLYSLQFFDSNKQETKIVADLSYILISTNNMDYNAQKYFVGGDINEICWDKNGERLAISFKKFDNDFSLNLVAVFITKTQPSFEMIPCGFVRDPDNAFPVLLEFKPNFEDGSLLTIVWENKRIEYVPFCYSNMHNEIMASNIGHYNY